MNKKILSFIMLFVVTFCFASGCKNDNESDKAVLVTDDGKEIVASINDVDYTADQLYGDMVSSSASAEYLYEQLEDLLIKTAVPVTESMRSRINNDVEKWKKGIKENATISGTSYKEALKSALEEAGVSSESELVEKKIFDLQEEIITNQYWNNTKESYYNNYIKNNYVYHISQILVSVSAGGNKDYFDVQPSEATAKKIYDVTNALLNGENFYQVAERYSDDTANKDKGGDMGIVTLNDTSIPNEVKYALASYSIYCENADLEYPAYLDEVYGEGFEVIPQKYVDLLGEKYNEDSGVYHITSTSGTVSLYSRVQARNILFNNLYNSRTFRLLQSDDGTKNVKEIGNAKMPLIDAAGFESTVSAKKIIVNEENIPILVVRSDKGIHFISITKSAFAGEEELKKYYSKEINETDSYRTYLEKAISAADKEERLSLLESFANDYAIMKIRDNSSFAGNEDYLKYDMFNYYLNGNYNGVKFDITDENIKSIVTQYTNAKREYMATRIKNVFAQGYEMFVNSEEKFANSTNVLKNIPILKCLDNKGCTYTHEEGFKPYIVGGTE
jgi:parvulin-like peptidyl-prolyl isomerase